MLTLEEIFNARSCYEFSEKAIEKKIIYKIYNLMKLGPTSANSMPIRIFFVESKDAKLKLLECVNSSNKNFVQNAPLTVLFAYDKNFYSKMDYLFPHNKNLQKIYAENKMLSDETALRNSSLQAAYFLMIARGFGLSCGPISGFNTNRINELFFSNSTYKINFLCILGYSKIKKHKFERLPKLDFEFVTKFL
ncbi:MAG: malonic semialdehyde reductase [Rickettsia sp.]|nr:malonic semialdehyde reductase [Rickettsia sp.]